jgi:hypothetical protein
MKPSDIRNLILRSLSEDDDPGNAADTLEKEGITYDFGNNFNEAVIDRIYGTRETEISEIEFFKSLRFIFNRVALTGIAAIIVLMISIFIAEGSISLDSFLGIGNTYDESMISLLTGN